MEFANKFRISWEVIEITYRGMITELARMSNEEEMIKNELMAISGVSYEKLNAICERTKQYSAEHGAYLNNLNRIRELLLQGYSISDICYWLQGNKYESMDWRNNIMPTNYLSVNSDLLNSTFTIKIDKDRQITQFNKNDIKDVIFNNPATIVFWKDGTKTVVKCQTDKGDTYNPELGLAMCIIKKMCGNKGNYNDIFNKWLPKED